MQRASVAVIFHRFGPYHLARLSAAGAKLPLVGIEVVRKDTTYAWDVVKGANGFRRVTLFDSDEVLNSSALAVELRRRLEGEQPAAVAIPGWSAPWALAALDWAVRRQVPAVLLSESQWHDRQRWQLGESVKRRVVRLYSAALVGGSPHEQYAASLGMPPDRIFSGYDVVDNEHLARRADEARANAPLRSPMGLPANYLLASCRFDPVKNLPRLLEAYARYRQLTSDPWSLVLLGDGRMAPQVLAEIVRLGLHDSVLLSGFRQYRELPTFYGFASCFVLASTSEPWGLVVNEAMAAGLPVLVSNRCGCAPDLVEEGGNGFTFDPYNVEELAELMLKVSTMPDQQRQAMGRRSREIISRWTPETFAKGLMKAVEAAHAAARPKPTVFDKALLWTLIHLR